MVCTKVSQTLKNNKKIVITANINQSDRASIQLERMEDVVTQTIQSRLAN